MRLILTTIILTMLAQPVWAQQMQVGNLYVYCVTWQQDGYHTDFETNMNGLKGAVCATYMSAMSDLGLQSCIWNEFESLKDATSWKATKEDLAAAFLLETERNPDFLDYNPFSFISTFAPKKFPCD